SININLLNTEYDFSQQQQNQSTNLNSYISSNLNDIQNVPQPPQKRRRLNGNNNPFQQNLFNLLEIQYQKMLANHQTAEEQIQQMHNLRDQQKPILFLLDATESTYNRKDDLKLLHQRLKSEKVKDYAIIINNGYNHWEVGYVNEDDFQMEEISGKNNRCGFEAALRLLGFSKELEKNFRDYFSKPQEVRKEGLIEKGIDKNIAKEIVLAEN